MVDLHLTMLWLVEMAILQGQRFQLKVAQLTVKHLVRYVQ